MTLLRSDRQAAAGELLVELKNSAAHLQHAAEFLDDAEVSRALADIAGQRDAIAGRFEQAVRELGELPSDPDLDRQGLERLFHRIEAAVSPDHSAEVLEQRLNAEQHLARVAADARRAGLDENCRALMEDLAAQIHAVTRRLQDLLERHGR